MRRPIRSLFRRPPRLHLRRLPEQERLPPLAQLEAERHLAHLVRGVDETLLPGGTAGGAAGGAGDGAAGVFFEADDGRRIAPSAEARPPSYTR